MQDAIADHGILIGQYHFLRVLWEKDEITQRELANAVGNVDWRVISVESWAVSDMFSATILVSSMRIDE